MDDVEAADVANRAVALAASRRKRLRGTALKIAARHDAVRLLARGAAAVPSEYAGHNVSQSPNTYEAGVPTGTPAPDPREQTAVGRLEMALETLAPYQRLACVSYFLDGISTDTIASQLGVTRERAIRILEGAAPTIARAVGDYEIPDFSAQTDEVEVVAL